MYEVEVGTDAQITLDVQNDIYQLWIEKDIVPVEGVGKKSMGIYLTREELVALGALINQITKV